MSIRRLITRGIVIWGAALFGEALYALFYPVPKVNEYNAGAVVGDPDLPPLHMVAIGDSTLTGAGLETADDIWIRQLAERYSGHLRVTITSFAVGGSTTRDVLRDQLAKAIEEKGDIILVSVGANDALKAVPVSVFEENLDAIVSGLVAEGTIVVLSGVGDLGTIPRLLTPLDRVIRRRGKRFDAVSARVAERHGALKVDMWGLTAEKFETLPGIFSRDRFHPTRLGHSIWADAAEATIGPVLSPPV